MKNNLTILLVEDDTDTCNAFLEYINTKNDITLLNTTNSSSQAISDILYYEPDAVILDLELHNGNGSGFDVLNKLKCIHLRPFILITTNNCSKIIYERARELGADYILYKQQENYSEQAVVDFLYSFKDNIRRKFISSKQVLGNSSTEFNSNIMRFVTKELDVIGVNPKNIGYKYLVDAISLIIKQPTSNLCEIIGQNYNKSEASVERAMQNAIKRTWNKTDYDTLLINYGGKITHDKGCPTLNEFVYYYANKIKSNYL